MKILAILFLLPVAASSAFAQPSLLLKVEHDTAQYVYRNEPVTFQLVLTNPTAEAAAEWNRKLEEYLTKLDSSFARKEITEDYYKSERARASATRREVPSVTIGSAASPWTAQIEFQVRRTGENAPVSLPIKLMQIPPTLPVATLDAAGNYFAQFGIAPESHAAPGDYWVTASLSGASSKAVHVVIQPSELEISQSTMSLLKWGTFYYQESDLPKAESDARQLLSLDPNSQDGLVLLGDILFAGGRFADALVAYEEALKIYNASPDKTYEPPEYLIAMIAAAKAKR